MFEQRRVCLCILDILLRFVADGKEAGEDWRCSQCRTWFPDGRGWFDTRSGASLFSARCTACLGLYSMY